MNRVRSLIIPLVATMALAASGAAACTEGGNCTDGCAVSGEQRCEGPFIVECGESANGCMAYALIEDCGATGQVCDGSGSTPVCGVLCTHKCTVVDDTKCDLDQIDVCQRNARGCMDWYAGQDCDALGQVCAEVAGDATCISTAP